MWNGLMGAAGAGTARGGRGAARGAVGRETWRVQQEPDMGSA